MESSHADLAEAKDAPWNKEAFARFEWTEEGNNVPKRTTGQLGVSWRATAGYAADQLNWLASPISERPDLHRAAEMINAQALREP
jgi:hypothetical protein